MWSVLIFFLLRASCSTNLVQNGDFEGYAGIPANYINTTINGITFDEKYIDIPSDMSSWYDKAMGVV